MLPGGAPWWYSDHRSAVFARRTAILAEKKVKLERADSFSEQVFGHIKHMILAEEIKGGEYIPEEKIAQKFGLVKIVPNSHAEVVKVGLEDRKHIGQVRIQIEDLTVRLVAEKASKEDCELLSEIARACWQSAWEGDIAAVFERDSELHLKIAELSGNPYAFETMKRLEVKIQLLRTAHCTTLEKIREDIRFHEPIIDAIRDHDAEGAARLMREHLLRVHT
jgi:DNA-binding GntR family transcriptional regulator